MAHQAKSLTALGAGFAAMALASFSGSPASATDRTTSVTQTQPIILAEAKKSTKTKTTTKSSTKSGKKTTETKPPAQPRQTRGSFSGG